MLRDRTGQVWESVSGIIGLVMKSYLKQGEHHHTVFVLLNPGGLTIPGK